MDAGARRPAGKAPHPNLVRAVLATAASVPEPSRTLIEAKLDKDAVMHVCGYGQVDEELAVTSSDRRVTLVAEGALKIDHFRIYEVPTPAEPTITTTSPPATERFAPDSSAEPPRG